LLEALQNSLGPVFPATEESRHPVETKITKQIEKMPRDDSVVLVGYVGPHPFKQMLAQAAQPCCGVIQLLLRQLVPGIYKRLPQLSISHNMIANEPHPVCPLIGRFRPLQGAVGPAIRAPCSMGTKYLIQRIFSPMTPANLRAESRIRPVFRLLQGSRRTLM